MVSKLSPDLKDAIAKAITDAETRTTAEIMLVVSPLSDPYQAHVLLYGFALGSLVDIGLWLDRCVTDFPQLLALQAAFIALVTLVPALRSLCVRLVPRRVRHHSAARRAREEYMYASRHVPHETPVVLLYVSLAERYAHIMHSRVVPQKVPNEAWDKVIASFTGHMKTGSLKEACLGAIADMAAVMEKNFPEPAKKRG